MSRTFSDSGVLIVAARREGAIAEKAFVILEALTFEFIWVQHLFETRGAAIKRFTTFGTYQLQRQRKL